MTFARPSMVARYALAVFLTAILPGGLRAQAHDHAAMHSADSAAAAATVQAYHEALENGDTAAVHTLLAADARIAESGGLETREQYVSHHLPGDMAFAASAAREPGPMMVTVEGDIAWVMSTSRTTGTVRERAINSNGAELMVLSRTADGWRIRAIHWSSRQAR